MSESIPPHPNASLLAIASNVLKEESQALRVLAEALNSSFDQVCQAMLACKGKIIVTGMGKSGHVAQKIASTLASTGTEAFYIHPSEAHHGDIGMLSPKDLVLALSFSGQNDEILGLIPYLKHHDIQLISITGHADSTLARSSNYTLTVDIEKEACPLGLAPTTSSTAMLALGDAIAISLLHARGFTRDDFAMNHPSGALGKQLLMRAQDIAHFGNALPLVTPETTIADTLAVMSEKRLGLALVVDNEKQLLGIFTDGDVRRTIENKHDFHNTSIETVMHPNPITIAEDMFLADALSLMNQKRITSLILRDKNSTLGVLHMHDILATGAFK
jgi:arabinose-5-phosphate isomerase